MDNKPPQILEQDTINVRKILKKVLRHWPWFVASIIIAVLIAFFFVKRAETTYLSHATLLIKKDEQSSSLDNLLLNQAPKRNIANEVGIIQSVSIKRKALEYLPVDISFYKPGSFKTREIYVEPPVKLKLDKLHVQPFNVPVHVTNYGNDNLYISIDHPSALFQKSGNNNQSFKNEIKLDTVIGIGEWLVTEHLSFAIDSTSMEKKGTCYFIINSLARQLTFFNDLEVTMNKESALLDLSLESDDPQKSIDLLNAVIKAYLKSEVNKKLNQRDETIDFIDQLIVEVSDTLALYENQLTSFQTQNLTLGIDAKSEELYTKYSNLQSKLSKLSLQQRYYKYVGNLLKEEKTLSDLISPSTLGINEPIINDLVKQLIDLYNQKSEFAYNTRKDNPYISVLDEKIANLQSSLLVNIQNNLEALALSRDEHEQQLHAIEKKLSELPVTNKQLKTYERKFEIIDNLYTYLLKKRSEARIERSGIRPSNEVVEYASRLTTYPKSKSPVQIYLIAFVLGLIVPFGFIQLRSLIFNKIEDEEQIRTSTDIPVVGHVLHVKKSSKDVFSDPYSTNAESFRTLRANLGFFSASNPVQVILVTSSSQGEGKSFIAHNLARSLAYNSKRTLHMNFDLRKSKYQKKGLSNFLSNQVKFNEILDMREEFLHAIPPGPTPPNAGELMSSPAMENLFREAREDYDYVVIDSPPLMPISDAAILSDYADIQLFVVRLNYTPLDLFKQTLQKPNFQNLKRPLILLNDIHPRNDYYSYYYYQKK